MSHLVNAYDAANPTAGTWSWVHRKEGSMLMANHSGRLVVLSSRRKGLNGSTIEVRSREGIPQLVPAADEPNHPDLRLIALAPELLKALQDCREAFLALPEGWSEAMPASLTPTILKALGLSR